MLAFFEVNSDIEYHQSEVKLVCGNRHIPSNINLNLREIL